MKTLFRRNPTGFLPLITAFIFLCAFAYSASASTIEGFVFDESRNPLTEVDVELRNENGVTRAKTRTNGIGRYQFAGLVDGRYFVKVFAFQYNLVDDEKEVRVETFTIRGESGNETFEVDFELKRKAGGLGDTTTGVVFGQEVPDEAAQLYKDSIKLFEKDRRDEGFKKLVEAVQMYPKCSEALMKLGMHLLFQKRSMDSASMFVRAVEVNPKSSKGFYYMGIAFSNLGKDYNKAALLAHQKAQVLAPNAFQIPLEIGKLQKALGNFDEAETSLLRAKKLSLQKNPEIHLLLAQLYADELKQYDKAADELDTYIKVSNSKDTKLRAKVADLRAKARKQT